MKKLLETGKIAEVKYPKWLANIVVVPKKNGKPRIFFDCLELNKAIQKEHFPLPFIEEVIDGLARKRLFYFLNGFSWYNQI